MLYIARTCSSLPISVIPDPIIRTVQCSRDPPPLLFRTHKESIDMLQDMLGHVSLLNKTMSQQRALVHGEDAIRPLKVHWTLVKFTQVTLL